MLDKVKTGDKVRFTADKINGAFTVTTIEAAK
jgi:Cu(I)/Ag(I) efflux system periplasmic protein CusF